MERWRLLKLVNALIHDDFRVAAETVAHQPTIFHYTDVKGALGIMQTGRLWFTERAHLNDPVEIEYGLIPNPEKNDPSIPPVMPGLDPAICDSISGARDALDKPERESHAQQGLVLAHGLKRPKEVQQILLARDRKHVELVDDRVGRRRSGRPAGPAAMLMDRHDQIRRAVVM
jgi:hypothetical protein